MSHRELRERFLRDEWPRQVGNLASTLARLSARVQDERHDELTIRLLNEGALLIEWCAPHVPPELVADLALMQRELILWQRIWTAGSDMHLVRSLLTFRTRVMSDRLLSASGLSRGR